MPFQIIRAEASGTFLRLVAARNTLTVCVPGRRFDLEVIFLLVKSWKTQVTFTVRLVQKQSFVLFVTEGLRFFCV